MRYKRAIQKLKSEGLDFDSHDFTMKQFVIMVFLVMLLINLGLWAVSRGLFSGPTSSHGARP